MEIVVRVALERGRRRRLQFELLENRWVLSASVGVTDQIVTPNLDVLSPLAVSSSPVGLTPAQVRAAYGFSAVSFGGIVGNGAGQTIAIVDAYNDPSITSDLAKFDQTFGLAAPASLKIVNQSGGSALPKSDRGWAGEIALDVEWAHAIAPAAKILLVEASSATTSALDAALDYARNATGVTVVSNSWGGSEYSGEKSEDVHFTTPAGHAGVTFTVAAGDDGTGAEYPSSSPDVLSVGGTSLRLTSSGTWSSETVWADGGGGASRYEGTPSYQSGLGITNRGAPDVSYDANPNTGFAVYDSYGGSGWAEYGGTSAGAPQWAALIAIADQGRALAGKGSLANAQDALYSLSRSDFHDITSGSNGVTAKAGYDLASGLGSPIANLVIRDLIAYNGSTSFSIAAATGTVSRGRFFFFAGSGFGGFGRFDTSVDDTTVVRSGTPSFAPGSNIVSNQQQVTLIAVEFSARSSVAHSTQLDSDYSLLHDVLSASDSSSTFARDASLGTAAASDSCSASIDAAWASLDSASLAGYVM
jgi:subtilase family serine protease